MGWCHGRHAAHGGGGGWPGGPCMVPRGGACSRAPGGAPAAPCASRRTAANASRNAGRHPARAWCLSKHATCACSTSTDDPRGPGGTAAAFRGCLPPTACSSGCEMQQGPRTRVPRGVNVVASTVHSARAAAEAHCAALLAVAGVGNGAARPQVTCASRPISTHGCEGGGSAYEVPWPIGSVCRGEEGTVQRRSAASHAASAASAVARMAASACTCSACRPCSPRLPLSMHSVLTGCALHGCEPVRFMMLRVHHRLHDKMPMGGVTQA